MFSFVMVITVVHSAFLIYVSIILICMKINYNIFQVLNFLKRKFESMFSISHDQELMEERLSLSVVNRTNVIFVWSKFSNLNGRR